MVGRGFVTGAKGGFEQRLAHPWWALPGQVAAGAVVPEACTVTSSPVWRAAAAEDENRWVSPSSSQMATPVTGPIP